MSFARMLNQPLQIQSVDYAGTDPYGNQTEGTVVTTTVSGFLEQTESQEVLVDRDTVITNWKAWLPAGTAINHKDRIVFNGLTYQVVGNPTVFWNPRLKREQHIVVHLTSVQG